jgi:hypothetical protein
MRERVTLSLRTEDICQQVGSKITNSPEVVSAHTWTILLLLWCYSPGWALASITIRLQTSRSLAPSLHTFIPIFLRSVDTSSSHLALTIAIYNILHYSVTVGSRKSSDVTSVYIIRWLCNTGVFFPLLFSGLLCWRIGSHVWTVSVAVDVGRQHPRIPLTT